MSVAVAVDKDNNDIINDDDDDTTINFQVAVKVKQGIDADDDNNGGNSDVGNESQTNNACPTTTPSTRANNNLLPKFSIICRICHTNDVPESLISPCRCKGTLAFVHKSCLEHWLRESANQHCELCQHRYPLRQTLRYKWWEALLIWYRNPRHRNILQSDILVCSLLTVVTFTLVTICILALNFFVLHENAAIVSGHWTEGTLVIFLTIVIFAYALNVLVLIKSHCVPWYRWWQSVKFVVLAIDNHGIQQYGSNDPTAV